MVSTERSYGAILYLVLCPYIFISFYFFIFYILKTSKRRNVINAGQLHRGRYEKQDHVNTTGYVGSITVCYFIDNFHLTQRSKLMLTDFVASKLHITCLQKHRPLHVEPQTFSTLSNTDLDVCLFFCFLIFGKLYDCV